MTQVSQPIPAVAFAITAAVTIALTGAGCRDDARALPQGELRSKLVAPTLDGKRFDASTLTAPTTFVTFWSPS